MSASIPTEGIGPDVVAAHGWGDIDRSALMHNYAEPAVTFVRGEGSTLYDTEDRPYLDFLSGLAVLATFGLDLSPLHRLYMYFFIGVTVFGVFGSFTYYLPELFPTRLRGTGAGFCYNIGRVIAAAGPFLVGTVAARGANSLQTALHALFFVGIVPLVGAALALSPVVIETKDRALA